MPSLEIHIFISLWWVIAYLALGIIGFIFAYARAKQEVGIGWSRLRFPQFVVALGVWLVGWPITTWLTVKDEMETRAVMRANAARRYNAQTGEYERI